MYENQNKPTEKASFHSSTVFLSSLHGCFLKKVPERYFFPFMLLLVYFKGISNAKKRPKNLLALTRKLRERKENLVISNFLNRYYSYIFFNTSSFLAVTRIRVNCHYLRI